MESKCTDAPPTALKSKASELETHSELAKLRALLLGTEQEKALREMLYQGDTQKVSKVLSEAIIQRNTNDDSIAKALAPVLDDAFNSSISRNPQKITNVIYPVIGPSIRKAVARSLADLVQSLNTVLENSLSLRAWGWRFKAWRAGIRYGEFVLLQTLDFRVEQVLLIHRHTGILLHAESIPGTPTEDPDLVSSMLTAINDFVADSFSKHQPSAIDNVRVGDFLLEIEASPTAMLVAVVRGTPSEEISNSLKQALERIHLVFHQQLLAFDGDITTFASATDILHPCLIQKSKQPRKQSFPWLAGLIILAIFSILTYFGYQHYIMEQERQRILSHIHATPGYIVFNETTSYTDRLIEMDILRPPTSPPPADLMGPDSTRWQTKINDNVATLDLQSYMLPYLPELFTTSADFSLANGILKISGTVTAEAFKRITNSPVLTSHFPKQNVEDLVVISRPESPGEIERNLVKWQENKVAIEAVDINFLPNLAQLSAGEDKKIPGLINLLRGIDKTAIKLAPLQWQLLITGFADSTGTAAINLKLSKARAELVKQMLASNGMADKLFVAFGAGNVSGVSLPDAAQRVVSLQLIHTELPPK